MDNQIAGIVAGALIAGLFTGWLAWYWKAENFFFWFLCGFLFPVVALLVLLIMPIKDGALERRAIREGSAKQCPYCFNLIHPHATICQYCHQWLPHNDGAV
jgi:MFS family permease